MSRLELAVVGAGAKGAAIAAKAACLREASWANIGVTLFEKESVAANWTGVAGYTDGEQPVCTPSERDLGFPYDRNLNPRIDELMQSHYSWMAYKVRLSDEDGYRQWVDAGSPRPAHRDFARYLNNAVRQSGATVVPDFEVSELKPVGGKWQVWGQLAIGDRPEGYGPFDGVVITGPGPAKRCSTFVHPALFDGDTFWSNLATVRSLIAATEGTVVIAGGGGTAAAVAAWLIRQGFGDRAIRIVANQATLYSRSDSYFQNSVFGDVDLWRALGWKERQAFVDRLSRAVVWESVIGELAKARDLRLVPGRVTAIGPSSEGTPQALTVEVTPSWPLRRQTELEADLVVDCCGFDSYWFADLLPTPFRTSDGKTRGGWSRKMNEDLSLPLAGLPPLHAPGVSQMVGPGFTSLMMLGRMSDLVLKRYVEASRAGALGGASSKPRRHARALPS